MSQPGIPTLYEDRFHAVSRRVDRLRRAVSWRVKGWRGRTPVILAEIKWRLGDEIMALPVYEAIKNAWPSARLVVHCAYPELLENNPWVDAVNEPCDAPDRYICLRSASRTEARIAHYARLARVAAPKTPPRLYIEDWAAPSLPDLPDAPFVAFSAGATWPTKRWSPDHWRVLIDRVREAGWATVELGQTGSGGGVPSGVDVSLVDQTAVRDAACVLRRARAYIGSDSGLMHLALAVNTPTLALFGPTDPAVLVGDDPRLRAVTNGRPCQGCWNGGQRMQTPGVCPLAIPDCLDTITPEAVFEALTAILREGEPCASSS